MWGYFKPFTVFENHKKSHFWITETCSQTVLLDRSISIGQKLIENAKIRKFKMRHFRWFSTRVKHSVGRKSTKKSHFWRFSSTVMITKRFVPKRFPAYDVIFIVNEPFRNILPPKYRMKFYWTRNAREKRIPIALLYNAGKKREKAIKESSSVAKREN